MRVSTFSSARFRNADASSRSRPAVSRSSFLTLRRMSTTTWSFLLRPVWIMPPTPMPTFSMTPASMYSWTSSYSAPIRAFPSLHSALIPSRASRICLSAPFGITPCSWSIMSWASVPFMSSSKMRRSSTTDVWKRAVLSANSFASLDLKRPLIPSPTPTFSRRCV